MNGVWFIAGQFKLSYIHRFQHWL